MDYDYLTTLCQFEVDGHPHPGDCGEPAVARVCWDGDSEMLVCQEHLDFMVKTEADEALRQQEESVEVAALGPQEPPDDPMIYNRRQADGTFRSLAGFWEREAAPPAGEKEA